MRTRSTPKAGTQSFTPPVLNSSTNSGILGPMPTADKSAIKPKWDEKLSALRSARRAKGLCMKCGEPYSPQHRCPKQIPLHVLEEVLEVLQLDNITEDDSEGSAHESDEELLTMSSCAAQGLQGKKTMRLQGLLHHQELLILVDSGSSNTFISQEIVSKLKLPTVPIQSTQVSVANGDKLTCSAMIPQLKWWTQGHTFSIDARVLNVKCYDLILGADWLEQHSPMWVHWKKKKMRFTHQGSRITLRGVKECTAKCTRLKIRKLKGLMRKGGVAQLVQLFAASQDQPNQVIPEAVKELISKNEHLFQEPKELPPQRQYDHKIDLIPGVKPVNLKAYRYNPTQKDEIERQVKEMLLNGVIQPSISPFASPVLLVKKKDGSWRFCIDYRQLNALTIKNKYPLPIVDELLDELQGASWFTKLDMRSGYHQIRVIPGDEHKTAFKTHHGHWEFRVMPFGLTNAPATFQAAMNSIFAPLLRKCILVFVDDILIYSKTLEEHLQHLQQVFGLLQEHQLYLKKSKCLFAQPRLEYLGHIISGQGVATDPAKIQDVAEWPTPTDVKQLRSFLGLAGYYRRFIRNYGLISQPLTDLLKKNTPFVWTPQLQLCFETLQHALTTAQFWPCLISAKNSQLRLMLLQKA